MDTKVRIYERDVVKDDKIYKQYYLDFGVCKVAIAPVFKKDYYTLLNFVEMGCIEKLETIEKK